MASPFFPRPAILLVAAVLLTACADRLPSGAEPGPVAAVPRTPVQARLRCEADVASGEVRCRALDGASVGSGASAAIFTIGGAIMIGFTDYSYDSIAQVVTHGIRWNNNMTRPLGTTDGTTLHTSGVQAFITDGPTPTSGTDTITVLNPDGIGTLTAPNQPYYQYDEMVQPGESSASKPWRFGVPLTVTGYGWTVLISTEVPYPAGWVDVVSNGQWMRVGATKAYTANLRNADGSWTTTSEAVTWSIADTTVATIDSAGVVRAVRPGSTTVSASTATRPNGTTDRVYVTPSAPFASITAGFYHTCALDGSGQAYCWGYNVSGRLGVGPTGAPYRIPTAVQQPSTVTFAQLSAGGSHTCALTAAGQAWCWGYNADGRVGDGSTTTRNTPAAVQHPTGVTFTELSVGGGHTCALASGGQAWCWGENGHGQLGDSSTTARAAPTAVRQPTGVAFATIRSGGDHTCAATAGGQVYCWGANGQGQLGDSTTTQRTAPVAVRLPTGVSLPALAVGTLHSCGLTVGQAWCWGRNATGQLGTNATVNRTYPVAVQQGGVTFASATAGQDHTCGLTYGGATYCWGGNARGQAGDATSTQRLTPVAVQQPAGATFTGVSAGLLFTCAVRQHGQGYCWGANASGQVGDSTVVDRPAPVPAWN